MSSTATSYGDGKWGIPNAETGFIIESITHSYKQDQKEIKDRTGNCVGLTLYNESVGVSLNGRVPKTSGFSGTLASSLTLGNTLTGGVSGSYLKGGTSSGLTIVDSIDIDMSNEDYQKIKVNATNWPNLAS